jgi:DNA-binding CsgD family transcriptional regulator
VFSGGGPRSWYRLVPLDLAEAYVGAGQSRAAEALLRELEPGIEACRLVRPRARLARIRALLVSEARVDAAFAAALPLLEEAPQHLERARVELNWGERLRAAGRSADAVAHLEHALARFEALGAVGWADRARSQLAAASGTVRPAQPRRTDILTPQELRVARHAAEGLRDREIAARLFLSPRTVESYLHSTYGKLGVANRTQLAGILAAEGIPSVGRAFEPVATEP